MSLRDDRPHRLPFHPYPRSPEPHILLFRRELGTDPMTGKVNPALRAQAIEQFNREAAAAQ